jgi:SAM-dependent methyltransferase
MPATAPSAPTSNGSVQGTVGYYDDKYFAWQAPLGEFGGWANLIKFRDFIKPDDKVIDYGCGGGYLLKQLTCKERLGIEINETARKTADSIGIRTVATAAELPDEWADVIVSNNALEHTTRPLDELKALLPKLKRGGRIVFVVPNESIIWKYAPNDVNQHIYAWSPMSIGNLFTHAGFEVEESKAFLHKWPRNYRFWAKVSPAVFHFVCRLYARWERTWFQIRVVARRPNT